METLKASRQVIILKDMVDKYKEYHVFRDHISYVTSGCNHSNKDEFTVHLMNGDCIHQVEKGGCEKFIRKLFEI